MARDTKPWIGRTDDSKAPPRVRQRVFDRAAGVCHWCKHEIKAPPEPWQADHVIAIINGGPNAESNLAPIHDACHRGKTGADVADKKKVAKVRQKHIGVTRPAGKIQSPGFAKPNKPERAVKTRLPPRQLYGASS